MTDISPSIPLTGVRRIERMHFGYIYRAEVTLQKLFDLIRFATIRYSPMHQRGFLKQEDRADEEYRHLLSLTDERVQIKPDRAEQMAVKYLRGELFTSLITWNARYVDGYPEPEFNETTSTLTIYTTITVPDTAHRHRAYYLLVLWKHDPSQIPDEVVINEGTVVDRGEILKALEEFDPDNEAVFCDIYNLTAEQEGTLYDEFNTDAKVPSGATAIDLNRNKTPSRRFITRLMEGTRIFGRDEVETRSNTIGSKSRKLTTNATMDAAARNMAGNPRALSELEADPERYEDLVQFVSAFFEQWAHHYPEYFPETSADDRHKLRKASYALSNVMMHPLFRLAYDLWRDYYDNDEDWRLDENWKDILAKLGGTRVVTDDDGSEVTVPVMSRSNPEWRKSIVGPRYNRDGEVVDWMISSTRQTREAAYMYLRQVADLGPVATKSRKAAMAV